MRLSMVGLGKMGGNMTRRLLQGGHEVLAYDRHAGKVEELVALGAHGAASLDDVVKALPPPRVVWLMILAGEPTATAITELTALLDPGDVIVDGGNSRYTDSMARARACAEQGIALVDAGVSGGVWGLSEGYCMMLGGDEAAVARLVPALDTLAPPEGWQRVGPSGAGHFTKMVHNGVEYALMQAYAEGFDLLQAPDFDIDPRQVAELWRRGSVVRSWLLDLTARALEEDPQLTAIDAWVDDSGEGRWTLQAAVEHAVPTPTIASALFERFRSRDDAPFSHRLLAALRNQFGGHAVHAAAPTTAGPADG